MKVYTYAGCGTCKKATKWLDARGVAYEEVPIRETPPSKEELERMLGYVGSLKKLFNVSGQDYRTMKLKDRIDTLTPAEAFALLHENGNLVKRPFLLGDGFGFVGFDEKKWSELIE